MAVIKWGVWGLLALFLSACALNPLAETPRRIALLAPFEGRYREIGYDALYAARLALAENGHSAIELLPIDDGGTVESATSRAQAFTQDPAIQAVILVGQAATAPATQAALGDIPALALAYWPVTPVTERIFVLESTEALSAITQAPNLDIIDAATAEAPIIASPLLALSQFAKLREDLSEITIITSASLPTDDFIARYRASDQFAPPPGLLSPLAYDATSLILQVMVQASTAAEIETALHTVTYEGLNGTIRFEAQFWTGAPVHHYAYAATGKLSVLPSR